MSSAGTLIDYLRRTHGSTLSDADLLRNFQSNNDEGAFRVLVERHGPMVLRVCQQKLGDSEAEDALQAVFFLLARKAGTIHHPETLAAWLFGAARRIALKAQTARKRRIRREGRAAAGTSSGNTVDATIREIFDALDDEIARLPERDRLPLLLVYWEGRTQAQAAREIGLSPGALLGRLDRARKLIGGRLRRRGLAPTILLTISASQVAVPSDLFAKAAAVATSGVAIPASILALAGASGTSKALSVTVAAALIVGVGAVGLTGGWAQPQKADEKAKPAALPAPVAEQPKPAAKIAGRVLDPDGNPVRGATLYSLHVKPDKLHYIAGENMDTVTRGVSGQQGDFQISIPDRAQNVGPDGQFLPVMAHAPGFGLGWVSGGKVGDELTVRLVKDQVIRGRIVDTEGRPQPKANVKIKALYTGVDDRLDTFLTGWMTQWQDSWSSVNKRTLPPSEAVKISPIDADGRFTITGAGADRLVILEVEGPGLGKASVYVVNREGFDSKPHNAATRSERSVPGFTPILHGPSFDFVATPGKSVIGTVRDSDGHPVVGATISALLGWNCGVATETDSTGRFSLAGLPAERKHSLTVSAPESSRLLRRSVVVPDSPGVTLVTVDVTLARGVIVTGRIIDERSGKGVLSSVRFAPLPDNKSFGKPGYDSYKHDRTGTGTNKDGEFRLPIIPGAGVLMVQANSGETLDGQYLQPFEVAKFDPADAERVHLRSNGRDASFVAAGNSLEIIGTENALKVIDLADDAGTVTIDLTLRRGKTAKLAIQDADGQPLSGAIVSGVTDSWPITFALKSAECPVYALNPKDPRTLAIYHPERNLGASVVIRGDETVPITAKLQPTGILIGRIVDADGQPIAGGTVLLDFPVYSGSELSRFLQQQRPPVRTDAEGRFKIDGIVPGLKFGVNNVRKGEVMHLPKPRIKDRQVDPDATLNLGDVRVEPLRR